MTQCNGPECDRDGIKKGLCNAHYLQQRRYGYVWKFGERPHRRKKQCEFEGCARPNFAHGLCAAHRRQKHLGIELRPVREAKPVSEDGYHWCSTCKQHRPIEDFSWDNSRGTPKRQCYDCCAEAMRRHNAKPGAKLTRRIYRMRTIYGVEPDEYATRYAKQEGACAICRTPIADLLSDDGKHTQKTAVDHDHATGVVRGLLCGPCNCSIGYMQDDPQRLEAAAMYLRNQVTD